MLSFQDKIKPVTPNSSSGLSFASKITPVAAAAPSLSTDTPQPDAFSKADSFLSDMPGTLGFVGSGIYNAGKGIAKLGGSAVADTFQAINHPIDSLSTLYHFFGDEFKGGADPSSLDTLGSFVQGTVGSKGLLGVPQNLGKVIADKGNDPLSNDITKLIEQTAIKARNENDPRMKAAYELQVNNLSKIAKPTIPGKTGAGDILGTGLNAILTLATFGEGNLGSMAVEKSVEKGLLSSTVGQFLKNFTGSFTGRALQSAAITGGFQVGSNLQEGLPVTTNLKQSIGAGLALPGVIQGTGKVLTKIPGVQAATDYGATALKKAIGFRGNIKEKSQYDRSVPIVYDTLKSNGFKLTDSTDPNNLINLDKAVQDQMTEILAERTARIKATGSDVSISGDLAAEKIRNLVEPGSVEDLTNPNVRERLDAIAKNFEGKKYSPVDAQKAIIQANTGFSLSDNPAMSKQIKMAISDAFTPELDRLVAGTDRVLFDAKGKPIPAPKGTAELNKKWSAFKTVKNQLEKKLVIEERRATYDLPTRLTGAQIAGKVGEAVGNPMKVPEKMVGGSFEWIANKIMGDRNNVNYRIYKAFNGSPIGTAIVGLLNKFTKVADILKLLEQNPLIQNLLEKILPQDNTLVAKENMIPNRQGGFVNVGKMAGDITNEDNYYNPEQGNSFKPAASKPSLDSVPSFPKEFTPQVDALVKEMQKRDVGAAKANPAGVKYDLMKEASDWQTNQLDRARSKIPNAEVDMQAFFDKKMAELGVPVNGEYSRQNLPEKMRNNYENFPRDTSLKGEDAKMQEQSILKYLSNKDRMLKEYVTKYGKISNADDAKNLFKDVGYNGKNSANFQEAASELNKDAWRYNLKNNPEDEAIIYIGGSGAGKTSVVNKILPELQKNAAAVLDGNFSSWSSGIKRIREALDAGKKLKFIYTYRDFMDAWENGVIKRLANPEEGERVVPSSIFAQNHPGALESVKELLRRGQKVELLDNSLGEGKGGLLHLDKLGKIEYPKDMRAQIVRRSEELLREGTITKSQYERLIR